MPPSTGNAGGDRDTGGDRVCDTCGRPGPADRPCRHCGTGPQGLASELAGLDKALSEMSATNVELERQRKALASKMQAAKHQRDVLARALAGQPSGTRRVPAADRRRRRTPQQRHPQGGAGESAAGAARRPTLAKRQATRRPILAPPPTLSPGADPEASSRSVQAVMLGLGALLLSIAAVVFVGVAITAMDTWGRLAILLGAAALALALAPQVVRRGLTSTAETVAAIGLLLVGITGYALWITDTVATLPGPVYAGLVAAVTAVVGYGYHRLTHLALPRYAALVALQPVLPLLAHPFVSDATTWAAIFTVVAIHNGLVGHLARGETTQARWYGHVAWVLHGLALGAAAGYATTALALADTVSATAHAGGLLVAAAAVGLAGTLSLRREPLPDLAAGLMTLALIASAGRVAVVAQPDRALLPLAVVVAAAGLASRLLPDRARRGPQLASAGALAVLGAVVGVLALRAGVSAVVTAPWPDGDVMPPPDPLTGWMGLPLTTAPAWQLAASAAALTVAAVAALPGSIRREGATAGAALTGLAAPASLGLSPTAGAWLLVLVAAGLALAGLEAVTRRAGAVHIVGAGLVGAAAAGTGLASPVLTAAILTALTATGAVTAAGPVRDPAAAAVARWAAAAATLALPGATATAAAAAGAGTAGVLAAGFAGVCGSLAYAVRAQLVHRAVPVPVVAGTTLGALAVAVAVVAAEAPPVDLALAALLVAGAALIHAAPHIDNTYRRGRMRHGSDLAAAAVTAGAVATLARITWLVLPITGPDSALTVGAALVVIATMVVRTVPARWRRGPVLGVSAYGAAVASVAAAAALVGGAQVLTTLWAGDLAGWPSQIDTAGLVWGPPLALAMLAVAAALVLPRPRVGSRLPGAADVSAVLAVLATLSFPLALGLPWWGPTLLATVVGAGYGLAAVGLGRWHPVDPRDARARALAAVALAGYAAATSLPNPGVSAAVLAVIILAGAVVAGFTTTLPAIGADPRLWIGGAATTGALLAAPGALAALAAHMGHPGSVAFLAALAGSGLGLATMAVLREPLRPLLGYGTIGIAVGATLVALASLPTAHPTGVYAGAAVLLAVVAELLRARRPDPTTGQAPVVAGWISPPTGALLAAAAPAAIALIGIAPALYAALVEPYQVLADPWQGPPAELLRTGHVPPTSAVAALLLTLAAALAAAGFGGAVARQTAPVIAPGLAITLLISPAALGAPWPAGTVAGLVVFTFATLGVALTPPPPPGIRTRVLRLTRVLVLAIGLAGGSAGLAGALADPMLTWGTFGGAIAVGAVAALGSRTRQARLLGWLGAIAAAQAFAVTTAMLLETSRHRFGYFLLVVAAVALLAVARLPRLRISAARPELAAVEWVGGFVTLAVALALAYGSAFDLAATLFGAGLVLGVSALWPDRTNRWRRGMLWAGAGSEVAAVWLLLWTFGVELLEAYTLPLALFAFVVAGLERMRLQQLSSWVVYGPGITAALVPSLLAAVLAHELEPARHGWVLAGGAAAVIFGSRRGRRAPVIIGAVVTAAGALHLLSLAVWFLPLVPLGILLIALGANNERRQRDIDRIRGALDRMR
jgi:hypothetical protein